MKKPWLVIFLILVMMPISNVFGQEQNVCDPDVDYLAQGLSLSVNRVETPAFQAGRFNSSENVQVGQGGPRDDTRKLRSAARTG